MDELEQSKRAGTFTISPGEELYGELTLAGQNTSLYLRDGEDFDTLAIPDQCVTGILHDLTRVTLIKCVTREGPVYASRGKERCNFASIFPHYVVRGDHHIAPHDKTITEVHFVVDDASKLFYDFDTFRRMSDARPFIEQIVRANSHEPEVTIGSNPQILYYTGKHEIFAVDTVLGTISATHNPTYNLGGSGGVYLKNTIFVSICFKEAVTSDDAIGRLSTLIRYLEILVGRPQELLRLHLRTRSDDERAVLLQVYWSMSAKREQSHAKEQPHLSDVLFDAVRQPDAFSRILKSWLSRQQAWHDARARFSNSFSYQQHYPIDRLIGSANMLDILPDLAAPPSIQLSNELEIAKIKCHAIFKNLSNTPERASVLGALGRLGKSSLKHKIRHRGQILINEVGERFPDLFKVTDEAVKCRNHYVHGGHGCKPHFDYSNNFDTVVFFTETLEFVFATSDLIEAGWDVKAWCETPTAMSHPFGRYRINYAENLRKLQALLAHPPAT